MGTCTRLDTRDEILGDDAREALSEGVRVSLSQNVVRDDAYVEAWCLRGVGRSRI